MDLPDSPPATLVPLPHYDPEQDIWGSHWVWLHDHWLAVWRRSPPYRGPWLTFEMFDEVVPDGAERSVVARYQTRPARPVDVVRLGLDPDHPTEFVRVVGEHFNLENLMTSNPHQWQAAASLVDLLKIEGQQPTAMLATAAARGGPCCGHDVERRKATDEDREALGLDGRSNWVYRLVPAARAADAPEPEAPLERLDGECSEVGTPDESEPELEEVLAELAAAELEIEELQARLEGASVTRCANCESTLHDLRAVERNSDGLERLLAEARSNLRSVQQISEVKHRACVEARQVAEDLGMRELGIDPAQDVVSLVRDLCEQLVGWRDRHEESSEEIAEYREELRKMTATVEQLRRENTSADEVAEAYEGGLHDGRAEALHFVWDLADGTVPADEVARSALSWLRHHYRVEGAA